MNSTAIEVIRYIGIISCLFLAIRLIRHRKNSGNLFLAALMLLLGINILILNNLGPDLLSVFPEVIILSDWFPFAYAPLIYLYIQSGLLTGNATVRPGVVMAHFIPSIANTLYLVIFYAALGRRGFGDMVISISSGNHTWFFYLSMAVKISSALVYFYFIFRHLRRNRELLRTCTENRFRRNWFISIFVTLGLCYLSPLVDLLFRLDMMESLALVFMVLWVIVAVYFAMQNPIVFQNARIVQKIRNQYYHSPQHKEQLREQISLQFEQDHLHRSMDLKLKDLAENLDQPMNRTSFYINDIFGMNFNELVNRFRLEEFLRRLETREQKDSSILELALDSGFSSKTSFNRVFKTHFHLTPTEYIKKQKK